MAKCACRMGVEVGVPRVEARVRGALVLRGSLKDLTSIVCDIDGTVSNRGDRFTEELRPTLRDLRSRGVSVIFATGRPPRWARRFTTAVDHAGFTIAANGAAVLTGREQTLHYALPISVPVLCAARDVIEDVYGRAALALEFDQACLVESDWPPATRGQWGAVEVSSLDELVVADPLKCLVRVKRGADASQLQLVSAEFDLRVLPMDGEGKIFELRRVDVSKAGALTYWRKPLGVDLANALGCGDMFEDIEFMQMCRSQVLVCRNDRSRRGPGSPMLSPPQQLIELLRSLKGGDVL